MATTNYVLVVIDREPEWLKYMLHSLPPFVNCKKYVLGETVTEDDILHKLKRITFNSEENDEAGDAVRTKHVTFLPKSLPFPIAGDENFATRAVHRATCIRHLGENCNSLAQMITTEEVNWVFLVTSIVSIDGTETGCSTLFLHNLIDTTLTEQLTLATPSFREAEEHVCIPSRAHSVQSNSQVSKPTEEHFVPPVLVGMHEDIRSWDSPLIGRPTEQTRVDTPSISTQYALQDEISATDLKVGVTSLPSQPPVYQNGHLPQTMFIAPGDAVLYTLEGAWTPRGILQACAAKVKFPTLVESGGDQGLVLLSTIPKKGGVSIDGHVISLSSYTFDAINCISRFTITPRARDLVRPHRKRAYTSAREREYAIRRR